MQKTTNCSVKRQVKDKKHTNRIENYTHIILKNRPNGFKLVQTFVIAKSNSFIFCGFVEFGVN